MFLSVSKCCGCCGVLLGVTECYSEAVPSAFSVVFLRVADCGDVSFCFLVFLSV